MTEPFEHSEIALAKKMGVAKKRLAQTRFRGLKEGVDWVMAKGEVVYAACGVDKLLAALGLKEALPEGVPDVLTPEKKEPALQAVVARTFTNRHLLEVELPTAEGGKKMVRVRVRDSKHFKRGMVVPVTLLPGQELWTLTRKEPRFPGKW